MSFYRRKASAGGRLEETGDDVDAERRDVGGGDVVESVRRRRHRHAGHRRVRAILGRRGALRHTLARHVARQ